MKAMLPLSRDMQKRLEFEAHKAVERERYESTQRIFKLFCYVLWNDYGFKRRCYDVIGKVKTLVEDDDPIFWEHLDRVVVDQMGMPFGKEQIDIDGKLVNKK